MERAKHYLNNKIGAGFFLLQLLFWALEYPLVILSQMIGLHNTAKVNHVILILKRSSIAVNSLAIM